MVALLVIALNRLAKLLPMIMLLLALALLRISLVAQVDTLRRAVAYALARMHYSLLLAFVNWSFTAARTRQARAVAALVMNQPIILIMSIDRPTKVVCYRSKFRKRHVKKPSLAWKPTILPNLQKI